MRMIYSFAAMLVGSAGTLAAPTLSFGPATPPLAVERIGSPGTSRRFRSKNAPTRPRRKPNRLTVSRRVRRKHRRQAA
jgi:hypothetical protein